MTTPLEAQQRVQQVEREQSTDPRANEPMSSKKIWSARAFTFLWILTVLVLPWQTRWFHEATLGGWSWEQGRWSVYASWFLIAATALVGHFHKKRTMAALSRKRLAVFVGGLLACTALAVALDGAVAQRVVAVGEWWIQVVLLGAFACTLWRGAVSAISVMRVFVFSLIPEVVLGLTQFATQIVIPMKWLGIAAQDPRNPGVAVIEYDIYRYLRIYGGFPHPNIFGSWLAVGLVASVWLASRAQTKLRVIFWSVLSALISTALLLTFARAAWIAAFVGLVVLLFGVWRAGKVTLMTREPHPENFPLQYAFVALVCSALLTGSVAYTQRHLLLTRISSNGRIETKSLDDRKQSLVDGWKLFLAHPLFGAGPNAELLDLYRLKTTDKRRQTTATRPLTAPLEPPHDVFALFIDDFGLVGLVLLVWFLIAKRGSLKKLPSTVYCLPSCLVLLSLFDHFELSFWSGQVLVAVTLFVVLNSAQTSPKENA